MYACKVTLNSLCNEAYAYSIVLYDVLCIF